MQNSRLIHCKSSILLLLASLSASAQQPDSTLMQLSATPTNGVPTTTIIPVAEPPIKVVDTTYIRTTPPDSLRRPKHKRHKQRSARCQTEAQESY